MILGALFLVRGRIGVVVDDHPLKPTWWLMREFDSSDPLVATDATKELANRLAANKLSSQQTLALCDQILVFQADTKKAWNTAWGDLVEAAQSSGTLTPER